MLSHIFSIMLENEDTLIEGEDNPALDIEELLDGLVEQYITRAVPAIAPATAAQVPKNPPASAPTPAPAAEIYIEDVGDFCD